MDQKSGNFETIDFFLPEGLENYRTFIFRISQKEENCRPQCREERPTQCAYILVFHKTSIICDLHNHLSIHNLKRKYVSMLPKRKSAEKQTRNILLKKVRFSILSSFVAISRDRKAPAWQQSSAVQNIASISCNSFCMYYNVRWLL